LWVFKAAKENIMFLTLLVASLFQFFVCVNSDYTISDDWLNLNTKCSIVYHFVANFLLFTRRYHRYKWRRKGL